MSKSKLFQYALLWHPNEKEVKDGFKSKIIVEPTTLIAQDEQQALMRVSMEIPSEYKETLDQVDIAIRPF